MTGHIGGKTSVVGVGTSLEYNGAKSWRGRRKDGSNFVRLLIRFLSTSSIINANVIINVRCVEK